MTYYFNNVYINDKYTLLASKLNNPIVKNNVNKYIDNYFLDNKSIEETEAKYQEITIDGLLKNNHLLENDISLLINSDLQN